MHVQGSQRRYWMELWDASFEVVRRRVAEYDGEVVFRVVRSIIPPVAKAQQRKSVKAYLSRISPRHIRVIQKYAAGKDLTEIAREEKSSRGTILLILRTAPFRLLECAGIIGPT
jgi:DNA-binding NarL/FixJ family response regulator